MLVGAGLDVGAVWIAAGHLVEDDGESAARLADFDQRAVDLRLPRSVVGSRKRVGAVRLARRTGEASKVSRSRHGPMVAVLAALSIALSACCHDRIVTRPVLVRPPSCLTRPAPVVPEGVEPFTAAWAAVYVDLQAWATEVESSCGDRPTEPAAIGRPSVAPRWWVGATGTAGTQ